MREMTSSRIIKPLSQRSTDAQRSALVATLIHVECVLANLIHVECALATFILPARVELMPF